MIHVVIPAAGQSRRFVEAGYGIKALVPVLGKPMMQRVIDNIRPPVPHRVTVVSQVPLPDITADVVISTPTGGSVESILKADIGDEPLLLVNQDQLVDLDLVAFLDAGFGADGVLATFRSNKAHHSYVTTADGLVTSIVEKQVVSHDAVTGIYFFARGGEFRDAAEAVMKENRRVLGEWYVSSVIAEMIHRGARLRTMECNTAILGTPEELQLFEAAVAVARSL
jgi:NDP-sugar pyrophosphorylase family protein